MPRPPPKTRSIRESPPALYLRSALLTVFDVRRYIWRGETNHPANPSGFKEAKLMNKDFLMMPTVLLFWGWTLWFVFTAIHRFKTAKLRAELRDRLLDKLGSSPELLAYLQTDAGKQFLEPITIEQQAPQARIIGALQAGVILVLFGGALLLLHWTAAVADSGFLVFGTLILALGIGFALAAAVSYFFSKSFGLLNGTSGRRQ